MAVIKRMSLVDQVYEKIRERIVQLKIPFGSKLNVSKLQEEYGVSSTPVREALNRLLNEGLIEFENNVGARVIDLREEDIRSIQELQFAYELAAARLAMKKGNLKQMADEIEGYINEYRASTGVKESCICIRKIHDVFYNNADSPLILSKTSSITGLEEILHTLFSMPREKGGSGGQYHSGITYFERIHEAVLNNDFSAVCDALEDHQLWARGYIIKNYQTIKNRG